MTRDLLVFAVGLAVGVLLTFAALVVKRMDPFGPHPDRSLVYRTVDGHALHLFVFDPRAQREDRPAPALLLFHGGAWQHGHPRQFFPQCQELARAGVTCISAEYRVSSRHGTDPRAAVQDARAAFAYLRRHAAQMGVDPERIAVGGGSAGGHLAATLGIPVPLPPESGVDEPTSRPAALLLFNPMVDLAPCRPDHHLVVDFWQELSPMQQIDDGVPPTLVMLGSDDPELPVASARAFCAAIEAKGGRCDLAVYEGARHGFFNVGVEGGRYFRATTERVLGFLRDLDLADRS